LNPVYINVTEAEWTYTSSVIVTLVGTELSPSGNTLSTWFDGISLDYVDTNDTIFRNGFD
jgi:hypothetical protein